VKCNGSSTNLRRGFAAEHPAPPAGPQRRRSGAETVRMSSPITLQAAPGLHRQHERPRLPGPRESGPARLSTSSLNVMVTQNLVSPEPCDDTVRP